MRAHSVRNFKEAKHGKHEVSLILATQHHEEKWSAAQQRFKVVELAETLDQARRHCAQILCKENFGARQIAFDLFPQRIDAALFHSQEPGEEPPVEHSEIAQQRLFSWTLQFLILKKIEL